MKEQIKLMYYFKNFGVVQIGNQYLPNVFQAFGGSIQDHLISKYTSSEKGLFDFFFQLSRDNQETFIQWINENYKGMN